jgi:hypothetical protein
MIRVGRGRIRSMAKIDEREPMPDGSAVGQEARYGAEGRVSRRRALIAGLAAAPVVLSLMNRSAWAGNCSDITVASFQQEGGLTASFTRRHPDAYINSGSQLKCKDTPS